MSAIPKTWDEWTDPVGNVYRPGDLVAVAVVSGRSPVLRIGRVLRINRCNTKGQPIVQKDVMFIKGDDGEDKRVVVEKPWCTVTIQPLFYGRGFRSWSDKAQTYQFPGNIVKLDAAAFDEEQAIKAELGY